MLKSKFWSISWSFFPYIFVLWLCGFSSAFAQNTFGLKGEIEDEFGEPIGMGNVLVLSPADSSIIKGTSFWDGVFELQGLESTNFIVKITSLGFINYFQSDSLIPDQSGMIDLGTIQMEINSLEVIDVTYIIPVFEREINKLVINVEGTIMSERGTALDVLRSSPNVIVKANGEVIVVGKGPAIIYLDGQRVILLDMLSAISSRDIKKINIIENPSAKYDAEGNAVIEIITRQSELQGYQGSLYTWLSKKTYYQFLHGGNINYRKNKFSVYFAYAHQLGTFFNEDNYYRRINGNSPVEMFNTVQTDTKHDFDAGSLLKVNYRIDSISTVFASYNGIVHNYSTYAQNLNKIHEADTFAGNISSETNGAPRSLSHSFGGGYYRTLDTLGSEFKLTGQYTRFDFGNTAEITQLTNFTSPVEDFFRNENANSINLISGQIDYRKAFSEKLNIDIGIKETYIFNTSSITFSYLQDGIWNIDSSLINAFEYEENILAGYTQVSGTLGKLGYLAGVRYEHTQTNGISTISDENVINRNYQNLFPNVQMSYEITPDLIFGASYINRINRPTYQDLDPFINFVDSLSSFRGNPFLLPSYSHAAEIGLVYFEYASIKLGYTKTQNPMFLVVEQNEGTNTFSAIVRNIESSEMYSVAIVLPYELTWWTTFNSFGYTASQFEYNDGGTIVTNDQPSFYVSLWNEFRIPKLFNIELMYDYTSPGSQGIFVLKPYQSFGGSISRSFFDKKLDVRFSFFDLFFTEIESGSSELGEFFVDYSSRNDTKTFQLSLTWNFGKLKFTDIEGKSIQGDERDRIKGE